MNSDLSIALDIMGGDRGPEVVFLAANNILKKYNTVHLTLVGLPEALQNIDSSMKGKYRDRISFIEATEVVSMNDNPLEVIRKKKKSSLRLAIEEVKYKRAHACVSSGNTGALMATAKFLLGTIPGVDRPAIISAMPAVNGPVFMLDLGANVDTTPNNLLQFAIMGSIVSKDIMGIESPKIGLLNIGKEEIKGNSLVKDTSKLLSDSNLNYIGFVEGSDIFQNVADVVVTDGFVGNIALKSIEGVASLITYYVKQEFNLNLFRKIQSLLANSSIRGIKKRLDSRRYNGATFVGLNGIVVKSHGHSDSLAFESAIDIAVIEARKDLTSEIKNYIEGL
ncbi:MAG: phosphate acyltransferase [Gammaproteobacteria bacterium TMED78]|nr:MAG: phosphate acyltransferase [Gammaproteobacteria bacterium TMED78]|tara:strand:- start:60602 stop:61609 length:1008 start_codon:yes stop_codon:yes gene_type:complete